MDIGDENENGNGNGEPGEGGEEYEYPVFERTNGEVWNIVFMGGQIEVDKGKARWVMGDGFYVIAPDVHETRIYIPEGSLVEFRTRYRTKLPGTDELIMGEGGPHPVGSIGYWIEHGAGQS